MKREIITSEAIKGELYFGVEIEALLRAYSLTGFLTELHQLYGDLVVGKRDGTVEGNAEPWMTQNGMVIATELVVSPMTLECYQNRKWSAIFDKVIKPEKSYTCQLGGHIHMSLGSFINRLHLYKYMKFIRTNIEYIKFIGERDFESNSYCKVKASTGKAVQQVRRKQINKDRYEILNLTDFGTLENRFFVSPFSREHLLKNVEWCHALFEYTKTAPLHFTVYDFHQWLFNNKHTSIYDCLYRYIGKSNNLLFVPNEEQYVEAHHRSYCDDDGDEMYECTECHSEIYAEDIAFIDGEPYCTDCCTYCDNCGEYHISSSYEVDGDYWCEVCYNRYALVCGWCGEAEPSNNTTIEYVTSQHRNLCESCRDDLGIEWCDTCEEFTEHADDTCVICNERNDDDDDDEPEVSEDTVNLTVGSTMSFTNNISNIYMGV